MTKQVHLLKRDKIYQVSAVVFADYFLRFVGLTWLRVKKKKGCL
jgi:hypothetical protein